MPYPDNYTDRGAPDSWEESDDLIAEGGSAVGDIQTIINDVVMYAASKVSQLYSLKHEGERENFLYALEVIAQNVDDSLFDKIEEARLLAGEYSDHVDGTINSDIVANKAFKKTMEGANKDGK